MNKKRFPMNLDEILEKKKWSREILADKMGKTPGTIGHWISGRNGMTIPEIYKLSEVLEMSIAQLFGEEPERKIEIDPQILNDLNLTFRVLCSKTSYAVALHSNIVSFHEAVIDKEKISGDDDPGGAPTPFSKRPEPGSGTPPITDSGPTGSPSPKTRQKKSKSS